METLFMIGALICLGVFVTLAMVIIHEVSKRGVKINFFLLRLYLIKYMRMYKKMTTEERGKVGPLFYPSLVSINLALILTVLYVIVSH